MARPTSSPGVSAPSRPTGSALRPVARFLTRFRRDEGGATAVFLAVMLVGILAAMGAAIDYARALREKEKQQAALDAALLAASSRLGMPDQEITGPAMADAYFKANLRPGSNATIADLQFNAEAGSVTATSQSSVTNLIMGLYGQEKTHMGATGTVVKGSATIELALVLDNSGSMAGTYIDSLKTAAKNLTNVVFAGAEGTDKVKVALIPFAASVKVGSGYRDASWIDGTSQSSIHSENFDTTKSRFDLFDELGVSWAGCVEQRPGALDTSDAAPVAGNPNSLFVPMFAPDEPDDRNASNAGYSNYVNDYISDFGGTCPTPEQECVTFNKKKGICTQWAPTPIPVAEAQARTCKYAGASISSGTGPNYMCTTKPVMALNANKTDVQNAIDDLIATGNTNVGEGAMWGWRLLSPGEPFTEGRSYSDTDNKKVMVVMTDGENTYSATSDHNLSRYGAAGYASKGRLGSTYTSAAYTAVQDQKLLTACANAKAAGIAIYSVAFRLEGAPQVQQLLSTCATTPQNFFAASDGAALVSAFQRIGQDIAALRVAN